MFNAFRGVTVEAGEDGPVIKHTATTAPRRAALRRAAQLLSAVPHPGVVSLVELRDGDYDTVLRTRFVEGATLDQAPPRALDDLIGIGAAVAQTMAELHDSGVSHGAIRAPHILVTEDRRPVLCGIGSGQMKAEDANRWEVATAHDVAALGELVESFIETTEAPPGLLAAFSTRRKAEALRAECHRALDDPGFDASQFASALAGLIAVPDRTPRHLGRPVALGAVAIGAALMTLGVGLAVASRATPSIGGCADSAPPGGRAHGRTIDAGGNRYEVGRPGDIVQLGDWDGDGIATPAMLRPTTGAVYVFDRWPNTDEPATAKAITHFDGARRIDCQPTTSGAGEMLITLDSGRRVPLRVSSPQVHQP